MNGPFDLIIFDYDGVIADSELLNNAIMAELLSEIGLPTSLDDALASYLGKPVAGLRSYHNRAARRALPAWGA